MEIENKKILMISFRTPWPTYQGGYILRVLNIAKILAKNYKVDLLTLIEKKEEQKYLKDLEKIFNKVFYFHHPKIKEYLNTAKIIFSGTPLQVSYYWSKEAKEWLKKNYQNYDLLSFNTIRTANYAKNLKILKVLDLIDAISLNYSSAQKWAASPFWKMIYKIETPRTLKCELNIFKENIFNKVFITSPFDKEYLEKNMGYSLDNLIVLPNGVKRGLLKRKFLGKEEDWLTFFGKMNYQPNEDACSFFAQKIFPRIKEKFHSLKFFIVGMNPTKKILNLQKIPGIKVTGFVKDPYYYLEKSKIIAILLRFGAGIQNKVLEAMSLGKTVVTTSIGVGGIPKAKDSEHLVIVDYENPNEIAEKISQLLADEKTRQEIGIKARNLILGNYTWDRVEKKLLENLNEIM